MKPTTYENATGGIHFPLVVDLVFHYVMQKSEKALVSLVCALLGIAIDLVEKIEVKNPIDLNGNLKETVMDLKLVLNDNRVINIELQMYMDSYWIPRSILYLCRAYDSIGEGDNYALLKPTTHICITDKDLLGNNNQFYSKYLLMNTKTHEPYSTDFGINVLQLNHIDTATEEDRANNLVYWAKLFKATTWEEYKAIAKEDVVMQEVGQLILELNTDDQTKELLEGRRRYREQLATSYAEGENSAREELKSIISEKDEQLKSQAAEIKALSDGNTTLANENATLTNENAAQANEIARLRKLLEDNGIQESK